MAKKKPDEIDKLVEELTKDATAEELLNDSGLLKELKCRNTRPPETLPATLITDSGRSSHEDRAERGIRDQAQVVGSQLRSGDRKCP